jgi:SAM-dependent methyltransferase
MTVETTNRADTDAWDQHWTAYAATNALNPAQVYRRKLIFENLGLHTSKIPVRLLDLGSGTGEFASEVLLARRDAEVVGLDLSSSGVELAKKKVPGANFFQQDFTKPIAIDERFKKWATYAVCSEVLEHLDDPATVLRNIRPYLAPGCKLLITVPAGPMSAFDKHIGHRQHFDRHRLEALLRSAGFVNVTVRGAGFPFFNLYRLAVVARGNALVKDAAGQDGQGLPLAARATIRMFSLLFKLNVSQVDLGWQLVALAS